MPTRHVHNLLPEFVAGRLGENEARIVAEHLQACLQCREEATYIQNTLSVLRSQKTDKTPHGYFSTVLPRVHARIQSRSLDVWLGTAINARFTAPLATVVLAIVLLNQLSFREETATEDISLDAVLEVVGQQSNPIALTAAEMEQLAVSIVPEQTLQNQIAEFFTGNVLDTGLEGVSVSSTELLLESLSDQEFEVLLTRLSERSM